MDIIPDVTQSPPRWIIRYTLDMPQVLIEAESGSPIFLAPKPIKGLSKYCFVKTWQVLEFIYHTHIKNKILISLYTCLGPK